MKKWQELQKSSVYEPVLNLRSKLRTMGSRDSVNSEEVKSITSKVEMICNYEPDKFPSIRKVNLTMSRLKIMEEGCQELSDVQYRKPPIEPIEVVIKK